MGNIFAASEIVEIGIQIEENGRDFYDTLSTQSKNEKSKKIFRYLAKQEEEHKEVFQKLLGSIEKYEPAEAYPGEYFAYMNSLAIASVFTQKDKGKEIAMKVKNEQEAIDIGMQAEKDSIVFYEGMKKVTSEHNHNVVDEVIAQEQEHLRQLLELKTTL
ncbi:MAG: ferritin family protein [Candidatus Omnitrophota bacterium]